MESAAGTSRLPTFSYKDYGWQVLSRTLAYSIDHDPDLQRFSRADD